MSFNVEITSYFKKQAKFLLKKYPSFKGELEALIDNLEINPIQGTDLGMQCYKIRVAIASKNRGKSGGARAIVHVRVSNQVVYLLSIYDKDVVDHIDNK